VRRYPISLCILAALAAAQTGSVLPTPEVRRVGSYLACLCGSCKNTVGDCPMLVCHYTKPARLKIAAMLKEGKSNQEIHDQFVKDEGRRAMAVPPAEGFHLLAWVMPFAVVAAGLVVVFLVLRKMMARAQTVPPVDQRVLDRYHSQIEDDIAKLD